MRPRSALLALSLSFFLASCADEEAPLGTSEAPVTATFQVRESVNQLHVTHAAPGVKLELLDASGAQVASGTTDPLGSLIFRKVPAGSGYVVRASAAEVSRKLRVVSPEQSLPPREFYTSQKLTAGSGYITTRDGTTLSVYVTLPGPIDKGPYPTLVNYSGYDPSKPGEPVGNFSFLCGDVPTLCDAPSDPSGLIGSFFDYATVSVNMRGTGCSGGAYDYFETLQVLDGYDVIETVAAQGWVLHNKVGMTGLSYPGISQLFVAAARPPGLAAITPLSVIGNSATTIFPGGILNDGFAIQWVSNVLEGADPYGQGWEKKRVEAGDKVCEENQLLHGQKVDNVAVARQTTYQDPAITDPLNPSLWVDKIDVPVFLAGAWQDEQTGPYFVTLLDRFKSSPLVRVTVYNGIHPDGFQPQVLAEWKNFLDLHVARRVPATRKVVFELAPFLFDEIFHSMIPFPPDRLAGHATYEEALAAYRAEPPVRVLFENGGGKDAGSPGGTFEQSFASWPPPSTQVLRYHFHGDGSLREEAPQEGASASKFLLDPGAGGRGILAPKGDVWDKLPAYDWKPLPEKSAVAFVTEPLAQDLVLVGTASADLWVRSTVDDADLEINLTEVRPDGQEMYVQSGWLRASFRALGADSTALWPSPTYLEKDAAPLPAGEWSLVRVPIPGFGHVFRAGSRLRVSVDTPGDSRAEWRFHLKTFPGEAWHSVGHSSAQPSSIALPLVPGVAVPTPLPACPSLRGQQCRPYKPVPNVAAD